MMQIFLAPRSNETSYKNFLSTIENGVDMSIVEPHLDEEGRRILNKQDKVFAWGNKETKKASWDKMQKGDLVLFYKGKEGDEKEGKLVYAGEMLYKQHSRNLGLALWPPRTGEEPWTCIFFLSDLKAVYIPISDIAALADYSAHSFVVQGFMPLNQEGTEKILTKFGSFEKFVSHYSAGDRPVTSDLESSSEITAHSEAELYLLKIGKMLTYDTYCPDRSKQAFGERLSDYITLEQLPPRFLGKAMLPLVSKIDVIWCRDDVPKFAFEVEHSTKFGSGFQRLYQLAPLATKLFVISSMNNFYLFEKFLDADPYYKSKKHFRFRDYKQLERYFQAISEFTALNDAFLH